MNKLACAIAAAVCAGNLMGAGLAWDFDAGTLTESAKPGEKPWVFAYTSDGVLGRPVQKSDAKTLDFRHLPDGVPPLKGLGKIGGLVFGAGCGPSFFKWSYGGFNGCGSVTSIVCRTKETLDWSQGVSWPEGCRTCLFQDMKKLSAPCLRLSRTGRRPARLRDSRRPSRSGAPVVPADAGQAAVRSLFVGHRFLHNGRRETRVG